MATVYLLILKGSQRKLSARHMYSETVVYTSDRGMEWLEKQGFDCPLIPHFLGVYKSGYGTINELLYKYFGCVKEESSPKQRWPRVFCILV